MALKDKQKYNEYMRDYMLRRYHARRATAIDKLGGRCVNCNTIEDLEFDHIDPDGKDFTIAKGSSFSNAKWEEEIAKCQLLCHECHTEKHLSQFPCGTVQKYWRGCRCGDCTADATKYNNEYRRNRKNQGL